ncbi:YdcH family protein [Hansschlegelia beijingensis]|uniref:YdcH family protein n=1 Tax=Hansschlegelia beijingensis TaxID=1133344 RepID=UPI00387F0093
MTGRDEETRAQERAAREELARLREEHRDLDHAIDALEALGSGDRLQVQRLKKRKLSLKDRIGFLEDQLTPDIIA